MKKFTITFTMRNWYDDRFLSNLYGATLSRGPGQEVQSYREVRVKMQDGFWGILSTLSYPDCPPATACKAYLGNGQVMERAAQAVEPARLQAVSNWRHELKQRRALQDQLQELKGSIRVMCHEHINRLEAARVIGRYGHGQDTKVELRRRRQA